MLRWVAAAAVGYAVIGYALHFPGSFPVGSGAITIQMAAGLYGAAIGTVSGLIVGALLWWSVRPKASWRLVPATAAGIGLCHALGDGLPYTIDYLPIGLLAGAVMGLLQLGTFRDRPDPLMYVVGSALGLGAGLSVGLPAANALLGLAPTPAGYAVQHALVSALAGATWALATGRALFSMRVRAAAA